MAHFIVRTYASVVEKNVVFDLPPLHFMADDLDTNSPPPPPPYLEVLCKSSGKPRRFAAGTDAGFALSLINRKISRENPLALHIEAVKEGEEPVAFGPNALLVHYGDGWKLHTITESDLGFDARPIPRPTVPSYVGVGRAKRVSNSKPVISFLYIGKVVLAFLLIFVLGAIFTLALDNLPRFLLFLKSLN